MDSKFSVYDEVKETPKKKLFTLNNDR